MANEPVANLKKFQSEAKAWLDDSAVDSSNYGQLSPGRKFVHFWVLAGRSFVRNRCPVRASALAYTTLLALIPLLAVVMSISTTFLKKQGEQPINELIDYAIAKVAPQLDLVASAEGTKGVDGRQELTRNISRFIGNINSGTLGVTGTLALVFVAISLLSTIEATFNDIWGVARGRTWFARIVHYWAAISLGPLVLILAIGLTSSSHFTATKRLIETLPWLGSFLFQLLPFVILGGAFALFYQLMPNTRVDWRASLAGGIVGGSLWQLNNIFNVIYVSRVVSYSKIYGSLGVLPVFLIGMYFSWLILLFGAQVAYAYQNRRSYLQEKQADQINQRGREFAALRMMTRIAREFQRGNPPPTANTLSEAIGAPSRLIGQLAGTLITAKLLVEVAGTEAGFAPARPLDQITADDILQALRSTQGQDLETSSGPEKEALRQQVAIIQRAESQAAAAVTLHQLVTRDKAT